MKLFHNTVCRDDTKTKKSVCLNQKILNDKLGESSEVSEKTFTDFENPTVLNDNCIQSDLQELFLRTANKNNLDDSSYINVLTPPKSVPDELCTELNEVPKPLNSLKADVTHKKMQYFLSDEVVNKVEGTTELNFRTFESKYGKSCEEQNKDLNSLSIHEPESSINIYEKELENMTLGEFISIKTQTDCFSPISVLDKDKGSSENSSDQVKSDTLPNDSDSVYYKTVRNGWTAEESGFLTFGELYLLLGKPSTIVLEYEFESPDNHDSFETSQSVCSKTNALNKVLEVALNFYTDIKNKQCNVKQRNSSKSSKIKTNNPAEKCMKDSSLSVTSAIQPTKESGVLKESTAKIPFSNVSDNVISSVEKHVFAMPVGTAPRTVKPHDQNSLKEEMGTRRGCRVRRKPLVVQRPLLPREGMPRPMTVVHFVPSISSLTTVIPSNCAQPENKFNVPPAKKVVQILPSGAPIDVHPIQVPIVNQVHSETGQNLVFQQNSVPASHVIVNSSSGNSVQVIKDQNLSLNTLSSPTATGNSILPVQENRSTVENSSLISEIGLPSPPHLDSLNLDLLRESQNSAIAPEDTFVTMQQMSMLDTSNSTLSNITPTVGTSFLEEFGLSSKNKFYDPSPSPVNFGENNLSTLKRNSPSGSPSHQPFRVNSPDIQWFNGESTELSFNTFLNSMESPTKLTSASTSSCLSTENSNFDTIARLAPVVDSQVRCLLDECSIDFITKFEDLADVINNSSSNDSKPS